MTTIAWDGRTLAADKMTSFGGLHATTAKIRKLHGCLVAGCGTTALIHEVVSWIASGEEPSTFPAACRDEVKCPSVLVIRPNGTIHQFDCTPYPLLILNPFWAIGSGRDFAMAAMHLGKSAREAVEVAAQLDTSTGNGVDHMELTSA